MPTNKDTPLIAASLLFLSEADAGVEARLHSHIFDCASLTQLLKMAKATKADEHLDLDGTWEFVGIEDLFCVVGPIGEGAMLGRTTHWDSRPEGNKDDVEHFGLGASTPQWVVGVCEYNASDDGDEYIVEVDVLGRWRPTTLSHLRKLATGPVVRRRIALCGSEDPQQIHFHCIRRVRYLSADVADGAPIDMLSRRFESRAEAMAILPTLSSLEEHPFWRS